MGRRVSDSPEFTGRIHRRQNLSRKPQISMLTSNFALRSDTLRKVSEVSEGGNTDLVVQNRLALRVVDLGSPRPVAQAFSVGISWYRPKQERGERSVLQTSNFTALLKG